MCPEDCLWLSQTFTKEESSEVERVDKQSDKNLDKIRAARDDVRQAIDLLEKRCIVSAAIKLVELRQTLDRAVEEG